MFVARSELLHLKQWVNDPLRKPLILRGARQVGKTALVREFAKSTGRQLIELNFERHPELQQFFVSNDPKTILTSMELGLGIVVDVNHSILFLDEVQAAPELLAKLRWFYEDSPELAVIAAGSLLEFTLASHTFSMPVGRVQYMYLEPLTFEDYLQALGKQQLLQYVRDYSIGSSVLDIVHQQLLQLSYQFGLIGGMPSALTAWLKTQSFSKVQQIHQDLLTVYRDDFNKYAGRMNLDRLHEVLLSIPQQLAEKFVYSQVNKEVQSHTIKQALLLLTQAKVCHQVQAVHGNGIPLGAEVITKSFKVIMLDVGLASTLSGMGQHVLTGIIDLNLVNKGKIAEQYAGQLLRTLQPYYVEPMLYYWLRDHKGSAAEVDYLYPHQDTVIPIEVKSGSTGSLKSLHQFMAAKNLSLAVRVNADKPTITEVKIKITDEREVNYDLISLPFYLLQQLPRLLKK